MNTCPICLSAFTQSAIRNPNAISVVWKFECGSNVVTMDKEVSDAFVTAECISGAKRIQDAMDALYNAFGYDADAACTPEQRLARSEYRKITMDRDGKGCVE